MPFGILETLIPSFGMLIVIPEVATPKIGNMSVWRIHALLFIVHLYTLMYTSVPLLPSHYLQMVTCRTKKNDETVPPSFASGFVIHLSF